jgi:peptidoglycan-N-acetylglucosamine deacetylase
MRFRLGVVAAAVFAASVAVGLGASLAWSHPRRDPSDARGRLDLRKANVAQVRRTVRLAVRTSGGFRLQLHRYGRNLTRQLCFGRGPKGDDDTLGYAILKPDGSVRSWQGIDARVERPNKRSLIARFNPRRAELDPGRYRWRFLSQSTGPGCAVAGTPRPCFDRVPNGHDATFKLHRTQPVGCRDSGASPRYNGPTVPKRIALTFDDGPGSYTSKIVSILSRHHAQGTFFEIGAQVSSESRAVLAGGSELANHSYHHENYPSRASMAATNARIKSVTGFEPCLFRPPAGAYNSRVVGDARALGMTTVIWNVDPRDWSTPGSSAIYSRVVSAARPGAIVVMHDGGGNRSQTAAALPRIIHTLHARGYHLVTVSKLLHQRTIWGVVRRPLEPRTPTWFLNSPAASAPPTESPE